MPGVSLCLQSVQRTLHDSGLHLNVVRLTAVSTHRYQRSNGTRCTLLTDNWRKRSNDYCRDSGSFNRSFCTNYCRAVAGSSPSRHENAVNIFLLQSLSDPRTGLLCENLDISAAAHETIVERSCFLDETFLHQLVESVDREHAVDVLVNVTVIVTTVGNHQVFARCCVRNLSERGISCQVKSLL